MLKPSCEDRVPCIPLLIDQHQTLSCKILVKIEVIIHKDLHYTVWQTLEVSRILGSCLRCISCTSTLYPLILSSSERKIIKSLVRPAQSSQHLTRWLIYFLIQKLFSLAPYFFNSSKYSFYYSSFQCYPTQNVGQVWDTVSYCWVIFKSGKYWWIHAYKSTQIIREWWHVYQVTLCQQENRALGDLWQGSTWHIFNTTQQDTLAQWRATQIQQSENLNCESQNSSNISDTKEYLKRNFFEKII